jgi:hypothetical protein
MKAEGLTSGYGLKIINISFCWTVQLRKLYIREQKRKSGSESGMGASFLREPQSVEQVLEWYWKVWG